MLHAHPSTPPRPRALMFIFASFALCVVGACGGGGGEAASAAAPAAMSAATSATGAAAADAPAPDGQLRALAITGDMAAASRLRLRVAGTVYEGKGASVSVRFNGRVVAAGVLTHTDAVTYEFTVPNAVSGGSLDIALENATGADGARLRTLRIEQVSMNGIDLHQDSPGVTFDAGDGEAAFDGHGVGAPGSLVSRNGALRFSISAVTSAGTANSTAAPAAGVYIDAARGDDSNPGSFERPWRSLQPLQSSALPLPSSQGIFLRCDGLWRAALELSSAQLRDANVLAGYGPECGARKATLSGADALVGGWQKSGNVWTRSLAAGTPKITQLYIDGSALRVAQWPNAGDDGMGRPGTAMAGALASNDTIAVAQDEAADLVGKDMNGATVQVRTQSWLVETRQSRSLRNGQIELDRPTDWPVRASQTYTLQDKQWMLDSPGEFFHDTDTQKLYVIAPANLAAADMNVLTVEATVRAKALSLAGRSRLAVRDLAVLATAGTGLELRDTPEATIERVESSHHVLNGLRLTFTNAAPASSMGSTIQDSVFVENGRYGIDAVNSDRTRVLRNRVVGTGNGAQHLAGVVAAVANGPGGTTEGNFIRASGYIGIHFSSRGASQVLGNEVTDSCLRLADCGAIYTWTGQADGALAGGANVAGNRIVQAPVEPVRLPKAQSQIVVGVYVDDRSHGVTVQDNLLAHTPMGIFVHNASRVRVAGNRIWLPSQVGLWASMDDATGDSLRENVYTGNLIVPAVYGWANPGQLPRFHVAQAVWFWHSRDGTAALATGRNAFVGNDVAQVYGPVAEYAWMRGPHGDWNVDAAGWSGLNPSDAPLQRHIRLEPLLTVLGPEKVQDAAFERGTELWIEYRNPAGSNGMTQRLQADETCSNACIGFSAGDRGDLLGSQPFALNAGAPHVYRWMARMPALSGATVGAPYVSRAVSPYDMMTDAQGFAGIRPRGGLAGETLQFETYFIPKSNEPARVNLQLETLGAPVVFHSVSVREVLSYRMAKQAELLAIVTAQPNSERLVSCADVGWPAACAATDLDGQPVVWPLRITPGGERFLVRKDTPFSR